jgi:alpha-L-arabinofuranosidase
MVATSITSPTYSTGEVGYAPPESNVAEVTAVSSIDPVNHKLYINFVNRDWANFHSVQLNLSRFKHTTTIGTFWYVYSPSVTDNNGPDMMPGLGLSYIDPSTTVSHVQIQWQNVGITQTIWLPPHFVGTLEIDGN